MFLRYTFEVAPCFTLCERNVIEKILNKIGYVEGDGIGVPGKFKRNKRKKT